MDNFKLSRPLDPEARTRADDQFYQRHPELVDEAGNRLPIAPSNPDHDELQSEWRRIYRDQGGPVEKKPRNKQPGEMDAPPCSVEYEHVLHATGDQQNLYCLTCDQLEALSLEEAPLSAPVRQLLEKYDEEEDEEAIIEAKEEAWARLHEKEALPEISQLGDENLIEAYRAKLARARERLAKQQRRRERIRSERRRVERELRSHYLPYANNSIDSFKRRFLETLKTEFDNTLPAVEQHLEALETTVDKKRAALTQATEKAERVRAALEAYIASAVAEAEDSGRTEDEKRHLRSEARGLAHCVDLAQYISEPELNELVERQKRINALEADISAFVTVMSRTATGVLMPLPSLLYRRWSSDRIARNEALQQEKKELVSEQESALQDYAHREAAEPAAIRAVQAGNGSDWNVVEIKRTGERGYRYIPREAFEQLKANWARIPLSEVHQALSSEAFQGAAREAGEQLKKNRSFKLKIADWRTDEDHLFNHLKREIVDAEFGENSEIFAASVEARMLRFSAGAAASAEYDLTEGKAHVGGNMDARYDLASGEATTSATLPNENGWPLRLSYTDHKGDNPTLHCGYLRCRAEYTLRGFAGASAMLGAKASINTNPGAIELQGQTNGQAFAGASLENRIDIGVEWSRADLEALQQHGTTDKRDFESFLNVIPQLAVSAGLGAGFDFKVGLDEGRLVVYLKGQLVIGPGGSGGVAVELDAEQIWSMIQFIRWSLEYSDFRFLEWVDSAAFELISWVMRVHPITGQSVVEIAQLPFDELRRRWQAAKEDFNQIVEAADRLLESEQVREMTPDAKAQILDQFAEKFEWYWSMYGSESDQEIIARASMRILETVNTPREFNEILRRMGREDGKKGGLSQEINNYERLVDRVLRGSAHKASLEAWFDRMYGQDDDDFDLPGDGPSSNAVRLSLPNLRGSGIC